MVPIPFVVADRRAEGSRTVTVRLRPATAGSALRRFRPGQFTMLYAPGIGEVPMSISGEPGDGDILEHSIRGVGAVSCALRDAARGSTVGVRGPFGTGWNLDGARGLGVVVVAGGVGLAPLRPLLLAILRERRAFGAVRLLVGARNPDALLYGDELDTWRRHGTVDVRVVVEEPTDGWSGSVGLVTDLLSDAVADAGRTRAFVCGPEPMMVAVADTLVACGVAPDAIEVSLERTMSCGIGQCGRCQLGPVLVCRDGPIVAYDGAHPLLAVGER